VGEGAWRTKSGGWHRGVRSRQGSDEEKAARLEGSGKGKTGQHDPVGRGREISGRASEGRWSVEPE